MIDKISAAEAKSRFSEILSRVHYAHDFFVIERKGKPVAALVDVAALKNLQAQKIVQPKRGLLAMVGAWKEYKNLDEVTSKIYRQRSSSKDREVHL